MRASSAGPHVIFLFFAPDFLFKLARTRLPSAAI